MLNAGMPIVRAIENVHKRGRFGRVFQKVQAEVAAGKSLTDIVEQNHRDFQPIDRILISVGEQTGQVAEMLEVLSQWYEFRQRISRIAMAGMMLPAFYVHAAAFLLPVVPFALGGWDVGVYFKGMFGILALFYMPGACDFGYCATLRLSRGP
jgi:type II secretory pathway component PulF